MPHTTPNHARPSLARHRRLLQSALALGAALWALPAAALDYCDDQTPCLQSGVSCYYHICVPDTVLCTSDSQCDGWEVCDTTCSGLPGATTGSGGGSTDPYPGADASSGGGGGVPSYDAGSSGFAPQPDAGNGDQEAIPKADVPDWDAGSYDGGYPYDDSYTTPTCPTDKGLCRAKPEKVPVQDACIDFCAVMIQCEGSSGGGGGSGTDEPAPPIPSYDAGSSGGSSGADAGSSGAAPPPPDYDAGGADKMPPPYDAGGVPYDPDAGITEPPPGPDEIAACQTICSLVMLEKIAPSEFAALTKCVAESAPEGCASVDSHCTDENEAFEAALTPKDQFVIELLGLQMGGGGGTKPDDAWNGTDTDTSTGPGEDGWIYVDGGTTTGTDGDVWSGGEDAWFPSDNGSQGSDTGGAPIPPDGQTTGDAKSAADASASGGGTVKAQSDGCTAGTTASGNASGMAALLLAGAALLQRRRSSVRRAQG